MKSKFLSLLAIAIVFASCSDDDEPTRVPVVVDINDTDSNISGNLTYDLVLDENRDYTLNGALIVKSGATLTIPAGMTIECLAGGTDVYLLVEKGGKIIADGDANNPITFTSSAVTPQAGDWGGVIINGQAPLSRQSGRESSASTEISNAILFGGDIANDNSGILDYVVIEYTGARIDDNAEHNGLTLNGVGSGTTISNIYLAYGDDDAIEFFGGTVNASNILVVNCTDDMFDFSQGYTGTCTNLYGIRQAGYAATTSDPRGIEADGNLDGDSPSDINQSNFTVNGITIITNESTANSMVDVFKIRRGATATITNAYVKAGTGASFGDMVDLLDGKGNATEQTTITFTRDAANGLDAAPIKNLPVSPFATITENATQTGASTAAFSWTGFTF